MRVYLTAVLAAGLMAAVFDNARAVQGSQSQDVSRIIAAGDLAADRGDWAAALAAYDRALAIQPSNAGTHIRAGHAALNLSRLDVARSHFRTVVDGAPVGGAPLAKAGLAMISAREGQMDAAMEHLEAAVAAGFANHDALDAERGFDVIRKDPRFVRIRVHAESVAYPCQSDSAARAFDFWIGEWDVYQTATGQRVGENRIESISHGCALLENWTSRLGLLVGPVSDGKSMNFVDPATGLWRQVWMGSGRGQNTYVNGRYADGAMRFEFTRTDPQGNPVSGRFTFHNLGRNRVRQHQESSRDGGKTYSTVYDFTYIRRGSGEKPPGVGSVPTDDPTG